MICVCFTQGTQGILACNPLGTHWSNIMIKTDEHVYTMTRVEFARSIGKSREAVKQGMRRGQYKDDCIYNGKQYLFKPRETMRDFKDLNLGTKVKRKPNRGNHFKGKYPNESFKKHNEMKMLAKLKGVTDPEVLDNLPQAIEVAKQQKQNRIREQLNKTTIKDYGGFNIRTPLINMKTRWKEIFPREKDEYEKALDEIPKDPGRGYY